MPEFQYEAINAAGKIDSGRHKAELVGDVEQWLLHKGLTPVSIVIIAEDESSGAFSGSAGAAPTLLERIRGVKLDDLILLCRQIATMLEAGVTILRALEIMANQVSNTILRKILAETAANIESGANLSDSFSAYPRIFDRLFLNVVQVGEESGSLDRSFSYLASLYENEKDINERVKAATRYPKIVISAIFIAVFILMTFVVPRFAALFANAKVPLPLPTRVLIAISGFFAEYYLAIILLLAALFAIYRLLLNYQEVVEFRDRMLLKIPVFGDLALKIYLSRFCRVFAVLTKSGINIIKTLQLSASAMGNLILLKALEQVTSDVEKGMEIQGAMNRLAIFPHMVVQMVAVGEESGQLEIMMDKVADYFESETNYMIKNLSTLIEPFLLLFLGVMVAFIALSIFLPMWSIMSVMRG